MERVFLSLAALVIAFSLDCLIGDPPRWPHPVRLLGAAVTFMDNGARRMFSSPRGLKVAGLLIVIIAAGGFAAVIALLLSFFYRLHLVAGWVFEVYILFTMLAGGDLHRHVSKVGKELAGGHLEKARMSVAMLVSRDTKSMDESAISRAALESLFENSADGLIAPLFFIALGGAPLAAFYKAVNTLDSMLGYKSERYEYLGFFPARLDDILSFIPSRLTALFLLLAGLFKKGFIRGVQVLSVDRHKHDSPNSAWPEAAAAGVLGLKFGGPDYYQGRLKKQPVINENGRGPGPVDIAGGLALFWSVSIPAFTLFLYLYYRLDSWEVFIF